MNVVDGAANDHAATWDHFPSSRYHVRKDEDVEELIEKLLYFSGSGGGGGGGFTDESEVADFEECLMRVEAGDRCSKSGISLTRRALDKLSFKNYSAPRINGMWEEGGGGKFYPNYLPYPGILWC